MIDKVKQALRIKSNAFDSEITGLISAARTDMRIAGVSDTKVNSSDDPLIEQAIITYCKANFGYDNPDAERLALCYNSIKMHLCLSDEYAREQEGDSNVLA